MNRRLVNDFEEIIYFEELKYIFKKFLESDFLDYREKEIIDRKFFKNESYSQIYKRTTITNNFIPRNFLGLHNNNSVRVFERKILKKINKEINKKSNKSEVFKWLKDYKDYLHFQHI